VATIINEIREVLQIYTNPSEARYDQSPLAHLQILVTQNLDAGRSSLGISENDEKTLLWVSSL
jgi:hypothetical protein